jgi:hypothetical protein
MQLHLESDGRTMTTRERRSKVYQMRNLDFLQRLPVNMAAVPNRTRKEIWGALGPLDWKVKGRYITGLMGWIEPY